MATLTNPERWEPDSDRSYQGPREISGPNRDCRFAIMKLMEQHSFEITDFGPSVGLVASFGGVNKIGIPVDHNVAVTLHRLNREVN